MNDEQDLLASAYLDGALTRDERARAEADPDVMAAVERLGELRRALAVVEPADPMRRDAAIEAALDAFGTERAADAPAPVAPLSRRRARGWWLSGAAAAAFVVIIAGAIIAGGNGDGGDDDAGGAADTELSDATLTAADTDDGEQRAAEDATVGGAATTAAAAVPAATEAPATTGATAEETVTAVYSALPLGSAEELTQFADDALRSGQTSAEASVPKCDEGRWLGSAMYLVDDVPTAVEVFLADDDSEVRAVDASTCEVVARAAAP